MGFLSGKRILVTGVASKLSIAYGIAQAMHREGAELAFTYQNDKLKGRVEEFAAQLVPASFYRVMSLKMPALTLCLRSWVTFGRNLTVLYTRSVSRLAISWTAIMLMRLPAKALKSLTILALTALLPWRKPAAPC